MKRGQFKKYEWTLKVLEECNEISSRDRVHEIELVEQGSTLRLKMSNGGYKHFTQWEMNEIICRYFVNS